MEPILSAPCTPAQRQRDVLLGALVGLARSTVNEPKTEDTDRVLAAGLRLAADPAAQEDALLRMTRIVETEKHRVAPNCATCTMRCGNTDDYDLARLWAAPETIRALKLRMLRCVFQLAQGRPDAAAQEVIDQDLFVLAEDWDEDLLLPWSSGRRHSAADKLSCNRPGVLLPRSAGAVLFFCPFHPLFSAVRA